MVAKYLIIAWHVFAALATVASVGKQRKPLEPGAAVIAVLIAAGLIVTIQIFWTVP